MFFFLLGDIFAAHSDLGGDTKAELTLNILNKSLVSQVTRLTPVSSVSGAAWRGFTVCDGGSFRNIKPNTTQMSFKQSIGLETQKSVGT